MQSEPSKLASLGLTLDSVFLLEDIALAHRGFKADKAKWTRVIGNDLNQRLLARSAAFCDNDHPNILRLSNDSED
jgi:hypothetical protein